MSKNVAESLMDLHAEAMRLGLPLNLVSNYFTAVASQQGGIEVAASDTKEATTTTHRKLTSVREFVKRVYPDLRPELLVVLCRFYGELFPNEDVVNQMVMDGRFFWDVEKAAAEPVTGSFVVHAGRRAGSSTLCRLAAAYEVIRRLEELEQGCEGGPYHVHLRVSHISAKLNMEQAIKQVEDWIKTFDPNINSAHGKGSLPQHVKFSYPEASHGISLVVDYYDPNPNATKNYTNPKYSLFISDADSVDCASYIGEKCRSFEVFTTKFKPHARGPNTLQVYTDLYAQGLALSFFGDPYATPTKNQKNFNFRAEMSPIRL